MRVKVWHCRVVPLRVTALLSADDLIASKEVFHEIGGELDCAFDDLGLRSPAAGPVSTCERCTCCH